MEKPQLHIEKPCLEDWSKMSPNEMGRHCQLCDKTVIDFTQMSPEEISNYLSKKSKERICGRIWSTPTRPAEKTSKRQRWLNRIYQRIENSIEYRPARMSLLGALSFLMVITGCEHGENVKKKPQQHDTQVTKPAPILDSDSLTTQHDESLIGNVKGPDQLDINQLKKGFIAPPPIPPILGEIEVPKTITGDVFWSNPESDSVEAEIGEVGPPKIVGKIQVDVEDFRLEEADTLNKK